MTKGIPKREVLSLLLALVFATAIISAKAARPEAGPPSIVFILADDLGYAELGCYGQTKIRTPNLDRLAAAGMRFTQHYAGNAVCATSRCVLMTGKHPGHAFVRNNREVQPEGQIALPPGTSTLAGCLRSAGYTTGAFGKWGLGGPGSSGDPLHQGFDHFFGYNCQRHAHNYYPTYLWQDDQRIPLDNPSSVSGHAKLAAEADPASPESYAAFQGKDYAPDRMIEQALQFIRSNRDHPFFLYFPSPVPHLALQVPDDSLAEYQGQWPDPPYIGDKGYAPHFAPRAAYAAMVTRLDRDVGRLLQLLTELGLDDNTLIVFTSDNGPTYDRLGGSDSDFFESAGVFRGLKGSLYEGGIRVPMIVRWPGHIQPGTTSDRITGFEDWLPTLLDLAGREQLIPADLDGISFASTLLGQTQYARPFLYREFPAYGGQQFIRVGNWKAIRQNLLPRRKGVKPDLAVQLYDLAADPGETTDLSDSHPAITVQLRQLLRDQRVPSKEFPFPALDQDQL